MALPRHHYSPGLMQLGIQGLLVARAGQRCLAAVLRLVAQWLPGASEAPCANTARMWSLRFGLYQLNRPQPEAEDWVWIMDHTVQLGAWKALVIVGVRLSQWNKHRGPLSHGDVVLLDLMPMRQSSGEVVEERLKVVAAKTGVPRAIVCDGGTDLRRGIARFQQTHAGIACTYDIKHKTALLLQRQLEKDRRWAKFIGHINRCRTRLSMTELACLNPPSLKPKARYMNLPPLVRWAQQTLSFLDHPHDLPGQPIDRRRLKQKLGWLAKYREALYQWSVLLETANIAEHYVRNEGYHRAAAAELKERLDGLEINAETRAMQTALLEFVAEQSEQARPDERLMGSSEVLESLIGKYKQLQGTHRHGGMTPMLLSFGAMLANYTVSEIGLALKAVRTRDVLEWCRSHLGCTLQAQRRSAFEEQDQPPKLLPATGRF